METTIIMDSSHKKPLNRDVIKYIAIAAMLLNHIAAVFLSPGTLAYEVLTDLGYFTAITMCYFLVEGYGYTRSKKRYLLRLLIFAVLSEVPYCLAFSEGGHLRYCGLDMLFTLTVCFLILYVSEHVADKNRRNFLQVLLVCSSAFMDWGLLAPIFTLLFIRAGKSPEKRKLAFVQAVLIFGGISFLEGVGNIPAAANALYTLGGMLGVSLAGICITTLYNGKRMEKGRAFSKWFFYAFYPLHLLVLGGLRIWLLM